MFLRELSEFSLQGLRIFAHVATLNSVAEAAVTLGLTQPAVSLQISNLEKLMGISLFERQGRRNVLTSRGQSFLEAVLPILEKLEQSVVETRDPDSATRPKLEIGSVEGVGEFWLSDRFHEFSKSEAGLRIFCEIHETEALEQHLITGRVSVIITTRKVEHPQTVSQLLMNERLLPVGNAEQIAKLKKQMDSFKKGERYWEKFDWIGYGDSLVTDRWATRWLENVGAVVDRRLRFAHKANSFSVIKTLLLDGQGICVAPEHACETDLKSGSLVSFESRKFPALKNKLYISYRESSLTRVHKEFVEWILKAAAKHRDT